MKAKIIISIAVLLQLFFLFVVISNHKNVSELIEVGVNHLTSNCPSEAPTNSKDAEENSLLKTSGDFFVAARHDYLVQSYVSMIVATVNALLFLSLTMILPKKRNVSGVEIIKT